MRSIAAATLAQIDTGTIVVQRGVAFDFPSGVYAFWTGAGPFSWNGINFSAGGSVFEIEPAKELVGMEAVPITVKLRSIANSALSPDVLATINTEQYSQRPATIWSFFFDASYQNLISGEIEYRGFVDEISHHVEADGSAYLAARLESRARDHTKRGTRMRSPKDQNRLKAGDTGFRWAARHPHQAIYWGMEEPATKGKRRKRRKRQ